MKICEDLRRTVLQAAIQGKLTEQKAEDGTAEDLLKEIRKEKEKLIAEGKIKQEKVLSPIKDDEKPFEIPDNWVWVKLGDVGLTSTGTTPATGHKEYYGGNISFIGPSDLSFYESVNYDTAKKLTEEGLQKSRYVNSGGLLQVCIGGTIGKVNIVDKIVCFNQQINAIETVIINPKFLLDVLRSAYWKDMMKEKATGTAVPILNRRNWESLIVPIPPLAEQHRIVERVDALMSKIDELEKIENELEAMKKKFPGDLRDALLQAAIQGKLTEQRAEDGTAEDLLKEIRKEKARLIADGKIKQEKALPPIKDDEIPFEIPDNWVWVRLGEIGKWQSGSTPPKTRPEFYGGNIPWLITGDLNDDYIDDENIPNRITELALSETSVKMNPKGSVLIAMYGATIGKTGILNIDATTNQACCACLAFRGIFNEYLFWILRALKQTFISMGEGGAQPNISKEKIVKTIFPLPPLAEQHRIVERLNELLPLCETMKGKEE